MNKACFLDRDGVLIEEKHYISSPDEIEIIPGVEKALEYLRSKGYLAIVVSNQSGVARGLFSEDSVKKINEKLVGLLKGAEITANYYCPHHRDGELPEYSIDCDCRKPQPGMLLKAAKDYRIDLSRSFIVGDKLSDIYAGQSAGCKIGILVKTGHGEEQVKNMSPDERESIPVSSDLEAAVKLFFDKYE
jgi:D-glycero-D-manno-heptose 1,7-bisphosphate phosphatase